MKATIAVISALLVTGCTGKIYTVKNPQFDATGKTEGVIYYGYKMEDKKTLLDRIRHTKTGDITHSMYADPSSYGYCKSVVTIEKVAVADYSQPYSVYYDAAWFESRKFGVTLDKGMLASVNAESTPGPKVAVETLQGLASLREDILDGFKDASERLSQLSHNNLKGGTKKAESLTCTDSK
ncbi:MAG: hypothetical protein U0998_05970 [Moraxellaceae bacterium]|nr:hypothetical protein [Moraxellaceae bacterium]MDZ4386754.1 hypothetical protein [Moraxellaceae bacterium]